MAAIKARDTEPEFILRKAFSNVGLRYKLHRPEVLGRPDIVFRKEKIAVFCDGDFWHGRRWARRKPKILRGVRASYWIKEIESNMARDRRQSRELRTLG